MLFLQSDMKRLLIVPVIALLIYACKKSETFPDEEDLVGVWEYQRLEPNAFSGMDTIDYTLHFYNINEVRAIVGVWKDTMKISHYYQDYEFELRSKDTHLNLDKISLATDLPLDSGVVSKVYPLAGVNTLVTDLARTHISVGPFLDSLEGTTTTFKFNRKE
jgi:hypothetical protein